MERESESHHNYYAAVPKIKVDFKHQKKSNLRSITLRANTKRVQICDIATADDANAIPLQLRARRINARATSFISLALALIWTRRLAPALAPQSLALFARARHR